MSKQTIEFRAEAFRETSDAILVQIEGVENPVWIPKSQIQDDSEVRSLNDEGTLVITEWIAIEKGLV